MHYAVLPSLPIRDFVAHEADRRPGTWVNAQARRKSAYVWLLAATLVALALAAVGLILTSRATVASSVAIVVLAFVVKRFADSRVDDAIRWLGGARAETSVGEELDHLCDEGFVVNHDIEQLYEGNIDHLVSGPTGIFMVETKLRRYDDKDLVKARRQAAKLHDELGVWVTPLICIHRRRERGPFKAHGVWVVPQHRLLDWIRAQRNEPVDQERLGRWRDGI
jgi:hypothetical protein